MALTLREVQDELVDCLSYEADQSVTKAKRVITLCNQFLVLRPNASTHAGTSASFDVTQVERMRDDARAYVQLASTNSITFLGAAEDYRP